MSMHKIPLTKIEEDGLQNHGLDIGKPSQLSDAFRQGVAWGQKTVYTTHDAIRSAGGIVHGDGNIFFTNLDKLHAAVRSNAAAQRLPTGTTD